MPATKPTEPRELYHGRLWQEPDEYAAAVEVANGIQVSLALSDWAMLKRQTDRLRVYATTMLTLQRLRNTLDAQLELPLQ